MGAVVLLPVTSLAFRMIGFRRWHSILASFSLGNRTPAAGVTLEHIRRTARMVQFAARRGPYRATCLPQSLTLWFFLRRQGIKSDLRLGTRRDANRFEAHAWVECQGQVLNDSDDVSERFTPFVGAIVPMAAEIR